MSELLPEEKVPEAEQLKKDFECEFGGHTDELLRCDEWIVSPGIPLSAPIIIRGRNYNTPMISEIEFGYQVKAKDSKIIAITGSNGKSTTASLIYHILKSLGKNAILAGNIGDAFCGYPIHKEGFEYIVLEISSFQLDLINSFKADVAVLLNITPDHLNRYLSFGHYAESKFRIFDNQTDADFAVINLDSDQIVPKLDRIKAQKLGFSALSSHPDACAFKDGKFIYLNRETSISQYDLSLRGPHNHLNVMAASLAVLALIDQPEDILKAVKGFKPLIHRLEPVANIGGVFFYNDSKATNTDSVRSALESFDTPLRVIMGGSDKGEDFNCLTEVLRRCVTKVYANGETSAKMRQAWLGKVPVDCYPDLESSVHAAFEDALAGDTILLSPACASYDQFNNFEHRGETFREIVLKIAREHEKS